MFFMKCGKIYNSYCFNLKSNEKKDVIAIKAIKATIALVASFAITFFIVFSLTFIPNVQKGLNFLANKLSMSKRLIQISISIVFASSVGIISFVFMNIFCCIKKNRKKFEIPENEQKNSKISE